MHANPRVAGMAGGILVWAVALGRCLIERFYPFPRAVKVAGGNTPIPEAWLD